MLDVLDATRLVAEVFRSPIVPIFVFAVAILDVLDAISVSLDVIAAVFVEMLDVLELYRIVRICS